MPPNNFENLEGNNFTKFVNDERMLAMGAEEKNAAIVAQLFTRHLEINR